MSLDLDKLGGHEFEDLIENLLIKMGFTTEGRKKAADGGVDIVAVSSQPLVSGRYIIQCKRYRNSVSSPIVRDLYGVVNAANANKGILITTSDFTSDAIEFARDKPLELIDGPKLLNLLKQHSLLVPEVEQGANARALKIATMRNELAGSAARYSSKLREIDSDLGLLGRRTLGSERDRKTYSLYDEFRVDVFKKLQEANAAGMHLAETFTEIAHSEFVAPEKVVQLRKNLDEYVQFLVDLYKGAKQIIPPSEFAQSHRMLLDIVHNYVATFSSFIGKYEDRLEKEEQTHVADTSPLPLDLSFFRYDEWKLAWREGMLRANTRFSGLFRIPALTPTPAPTSTTSTGSGGRFSEAELNALKLVGKNGREPVRAGMNDFETLVVKGYLKKTGLMTKFYKLTEDGKNELFLDGEGG